MSINKIIGIFDNNYYSRLAIRKSSLIKRINLFLISLKNFLDIKVANLLYKNFPIIIPKNG